MKRGKDEEKAMGPMFPRLHVNDTAEKGGPRAPPRNKMALYEQLSIPSQRFGSGVVPPNSHNKPNMASSASSSQASGFDRNLYPRQLSASTTVPWSEKFHAYHPDGTNENVSAAQFEQRKNVEDEDDFTVPVFVQARVSKCQDKTQNTTDRETASSISSTRSGRLVEWRNTSDIVPKHNNLTDTNFRQEVISQSKENTKSGGQNVIRPVMFSTKQWTVENVDGHMKEDKTSSGQECRGHAMPNFGRSADGDTCLHQEPRVVAQVDSSRRSENLIESTADRPRSEPHCVEDRSRINEPENDSDHNSNSNRTSISLPLESVDKGDDASETSMLDSILGLDITPDEVVGIIGQKHFWKARKAIVHQQRVFAVQVFELHRLIKVQQLIAGSPHILLQERAFLGKSSLKVSPVKNLPSEVVANSLPVAGNCKDDSEKPSHKKECSRGVSVGKSSVSSVKNSSQGVNYGPYMGHPQPAVTTNDNKMGPWCFPQPPGPQWLVPVMSPSEGLVYKPYPGPGLPAAVYGGYGPFGSTPVAGNYANSAYGIPASHPQGFGGFPAASPVGHTYFYPYSMPIANPAMSASAIEQASQSVGAGSHSQTGPIAGVVVNINTEQQSSCTVPTQKNESKSQARMVQASKGSDIQGGSTASGPCDASKGAGISQNIEGRDPLPLFPLAPVAPEGDPTSHIAGQPTRAIKVVPHNPRSATESAARIFRFIQEERKQYDAV